MKHVLARYRLKQDKISEAENAIHAFIHTVQSEGDTLAYEAFCEPDGVSYVHLMTFRDEAAEQEHRNAAHTKKFVALLYPLCEEEPVFTELRLVDWTKYAPPS